MNTAANRIVHTAQLILAGGIGLIGSMTVASPADSEPAGRAMPSYEIIDLGDFGGELAGALAINEAGHVVGRAENQNRITLPFLWRGGALEYLGTLAGPGIAFSEGWAMAISNNGRVAGHSLAPAAGGVGMKGHPFIWSAADGMREIHPSYGYCLGVNSSGQVVGYAGGVGGFLWTAQGGLVPLGLSSDMTGLAPEVTASNEVKAINEAGVAVGSQYGGNAMIAWKYDSATGVTQALPGLGLATRANAINSGGDIVGMSIRPNNQIRPVLWTREGQLIDLGQLPVTGYDFGEATAINDRRWIVGTDEYVGSGRWPKAWLWIDGAKVELRGLIADPIQRAAWPELPWVTGINGRGEIVGQGEHNGIPGRAFLMRPLREIIFVDGFEAR